MGLSAGHRVTATDSRRTEGSGLADDDTPMLFTLNLMSVPFLCTKEMQKELGLGH